jgi:hypothetical protein
VGWWIILGMVNLDHILTPVALDHVVFQLNYGLSRRVYACVRIFGIRVAMWQLSPGNQ